MFPWNYANTCYDSSSSGLLVKTIYYSNVSTNAYLQWLRYRKTNSNEGVKQNKYKMVHHL